MYDESVTTVVLAAVVRGGRRQRRRWPSSSPGCSPGRSPRSARAARRIAEGDYAARVPREGPEEIASLADSFNQMAASLERQEAMRRDFIANAAHELRTPLTNLQGYLEALRDGVIDGRPGDLRLALGRGRAARPAVAFARRAGRGRRRDQHRRALVELDLRRRSGPRSSSPNRPSTGPACASSSTCRSICRPGPTPITSPRCSATCCRTRPATRRPAGTVTVRAERRPADLLVSIANTGEGIPPEDLDRVFERFYRVEKSRDRAHGGAGIGLAIVKQLVEAGGGRVGAESGDGTDALLVQPAGVSAGARRASCYHSGPVARPRTRRRPPVGM